MRAMKVGRTPRAKALIVAAAAAVFISTFLCVFQSFQSIDGLEKIKMHNDETLALPAPPIPTTTPYNTSKTHNNEPLRFPRDPPMPKITPYNLSSVMTSIKAFKSDSQVFLFVYDPLTDRFIVIDVKNSKHSERAKIVAPILARALRLNFPNRFPSQHEFVMVISTRDHPDLREPCLQRKKSKKCRGGSPVLQFGSVYRDEELFPMPMIPMPMHAMPHLPCFDIWQYNLFVKGKRETCEQLRHGLYIDQDAKWENLIPQIIWRGTDFNFLGLQGPSFNRDVRPKLAGLKGDKATEAAIQALTDVRQKPPRWKGVIITTQAELSLNQSKAANETNSLPWVNIKFSVWRSDLEKKKTPNLLAFQKVGIATIGEYISPQNHSSYRYHIDLGGGGGTTFTGTIQKLAMPGLLFHHMTKTKDYFHDMLKERVHYVPVQTNLNDLEASFKWAESNPQEAEKISKQATEFMLWMGSPEGFETIYTEYLVNPLRKCIESYEHLNIENGTSIIEIIKESGHLMDYDIVANLSGMSEKWEEETSSYYHIVE